MFPSDFKDFPYPIVRREDGCIAWRDYPASLNKVDHRTLGWDTLTPREVGLICSVPNINRNMQVKFNVAISVEFIYIVGGGI